VIALGARAKGATIHQVCAARGIETSAGRVSAVITERGVIRTKIAILAGGVWSPLFAGNLGLTLPQLYTFASNQSIAPIGGEPLITGGWGRSNWRMEPDGGYTVGLFAGITPIGWETLRFGFRYLPALRHMSEIDIGCGEESWRSFTLARHWQPDQRTPFEDVRIMEPAPRNPVLDQSLEEVVGALPAFKNARVRERYAGALCTTPDNMPVISTVTAIPGLLMGTGIYFGLTIAPAAGELLADLATGATPRVDPRPFRYERLVDGTSLTFQP
jgi:glycine/D-amino acid oxidase-like deaminating enzyme